MKNMKQCFVFVICDLIHAGAEAGKEEREELIWSLVCKAEVIDS